MRTFLSAARSLAVPPAIWLAAAIAISAPFPSSAQAQNQALPVPAPQPPPTPQPPQTPQLPETKPDADAAQSVPEVPTTNAPAQSRFAPPRYRLGVVTVPVSLSMGPRFQPPDRPSGDMGQRIVQVQPGSAAQRSGLEVGDIIITANGRKAQTVDDLSQAIAASGGVLELTIRNVRNGQNQRVRVPLDPIGPGPGPGPFPPSRGAPIIAVGVLQTGIVAPGAETTGYAIRTPSGVRFELDLSGRPDFTRLARRLDGRPVLVSGLLESRTGVETGRRTVIVVDSLAADSLRPRPYEPTPIPGFPRAFDAPPNATSPVPGSSDPDPR